MHIKPSVKVINDAIMPNVPMAEAYVPSSMKREMTEPIKSPAIAMCDKVWKRMSMKLTKRAEIRSPMIAPQANIARIAKLKLVTAPKIVA